MEGRCRFLLHAGIQAGSVTILRAAVKFAKETHQLQVLTTVIPKPGPCAGLLPVQYAFDVKLQDDKNRPGVLDLLLQQHGDGGLDRSILNSLLQRSCGLGCRQCVQVFLQHGAEPTAAVLACLVSIKRKGEAAMGCLLTVLQAGANVSEEGQVKEDTFLSYAVQLEVRDPIAYTNMIRHLLQHGAAQAVNYPDDFGRTPLMWAKTPAVARLLMDAGSSITCTDCGNLTALQHAVEANRWTVSKVIQHRLAKHGLKQQHRVLKRY